MLDAVFVNGIIATQPRHIVTAEGLAITSFRLASTQRRSDRATQSGSDGEVNWYTVTAFRQLAVNAAVSLNRGDRVMVDGRLRIREWASGERLGTTVEIEAESIGHDLTWGTTQVNRVTPVADRAAEQQAAATLEPSPPKPSRAHVASHEVAR